MKKSTSKTSTKKTAKRANAEAPIPHAPRRFTLEQILAAAESDHDLAADMPEMTPATGERYFGERDALSSFLGGVAEDVTWRTKVGELRPCEVLGYLALCTGDLTIMRGVAAYAMRAEAVANLCREETEATKGAA